MAAAVGSSTAAVDRMRSARSEVRRRTGGPAGGRGDRGDTGSGVAHSGRAGLWSMGSGSEGFGAEMVRWAATGKRQIDVKLTLFLQRLFAVEDPGGRTRRGRRCGST